MAAPCLAFRVPPRASSASCACSPASLGSSSATSVHAVRSLHVQMEPSQLHRYASLGPQAPRPVRRLVRRKDPAFLRSVGPSHASEVHAAQQAIDRTATQVRQGGCGHSSVLPSHAAQHPDSAAITSAAPLPQGVARPGRANTADQLRSGAPVRLAGGGTGRHLSLPYGCRPELRQLHRVVRQPRPTSRIPDSPCGQLRIRPGFDAAQRAEWQLP